MQRLDEYFNAPLAWPPEERPMRIEHTLMKLKDLDVDELDSEERLPFDSAESRFLIGYSFRTKLRDILFVSQRRNNLGVLRSDLSWLRRASAYEEIMRYSYRDYFEKFVFPYFSSRIPSLTRESFLWSADLRAYGHALAANPNCRVVNNRNDFLATADDMAFLESVFAPSRLVVFEEGGHMGNFHHSEVQQAILDTLKGVR
ncbi:MAG: hypothetical protein BWZ10_02604 [candidate division BRC1 bacterium ADurb.BinA364]|nr:MAG: hypothetical protein BWZ10_02604 [candidate division BRC1 bacterium ADurb.BinA364]